MRTKNVVVTAAIVYGLASVTSWLAPAVTHTVWTLLVGAWLAMVSIVARPLGRLTRPYHPVIAGHLARVAAARPTLAGLVSLAGRHASGGWSLPIRPGRAQRGPAAHTVHATATKVSV